MTNETNNTSSIISKVWSFMTILRDDGVGYHRTDKSEETQKAEGRNYA